MPFPNQRQHRERVWRNGQRGCLQARLVVENGTLTTNDIVAGSAAIQDHTVLLVARLRTDYSGSADDITLWLFSTNMVYPNARTVAGLGPKVYTSSIAQNLWGSSLDGIWLRLKSQNSADRDFYVDSLRVSYGAALSDDDMVYEIMTGVAVPEPALFSVLGAGLVLAARRRV